MTVNVQVSELAGKMEQKQVPDTLNQSINGSCCIKVAGRETFKS